MLKKKTKKSKFILTPTEICGWYGMIALILGYLMVSVGMIDSGGLLYQLLNITGAAGLLIIAESKHVIQSIIVNSFWVLIGFVVIIRLVFSW